MIDTSDWPNRSVYTVAESMGSMARDARRNVLAILRLLDGTYVTPERLDRIEKEARQLKETGEWMLDAVAYIRKQTEEAGR